MHYQDLMQRYQIGSLLAKVLDYFQWDANEIQDFLTERKAVDVSGHPVLHKILQRLQLAKEKQEKVFVFGDYDTDGICATAMMVKWLRRLGIETGYYIPNRLQEGYGLNVTRTKQAIEKGYSVIITVDNGVKAYEALEYAKQQAVDCIVCDHHTLEESVDCFALWHPSMIHPDCQYLCGAGCVLQLIKGSTIDCSDFLGLAMVATIGDMMILKDENRWIVQQGLKLLQNGHYPTVNALLNQPPAYATVDDIAFQVVPKLNSIGRLADRANVNQVVSYLLCEDPIEIQIIAKQIANINDQRKQMTAQHCEYVNAQQLDASFIVLADERFHPGIVGLLANKLCKQYHKPVMVVAKKEGEYVGSIRSIEGVNAMECITGIACYLNAYGGHAQAAGLSFDESYFEPIKQYLQTYSYTELESTIDCVEISKEDLQVANIRELFQYGPFGQGVMLPLFCYTQPEIQSYQFMKKETYLKWNLAGMEAVWFSTTNTYSDFVNKNNLNFIGKLGCNVFKGQCKYVLQLEHVENSHAQSEKICYNNNVKMEA